MTTSTSPDPTSIRTALRQWAADLIGIDLAAVQWEDEPRKLITGMSALLDAIADRSIGQSESQTQYDATAASGEEIVRAIGGPRVLTLSMKLDGYDQRLHVSPFFQLSSVAEKIRGEVSCSALRAMGFALVDITGPSNISRAEGGRAYPRAVLDISLGYTRVEYEQSTTWIERVRVSSQLADVDEVVLPSPPNEEITIEEI